MQDARYAYEVDNPRESHARNCRVLIYNKMDEYDAHLCRTNTKFRKKRLADLARDDKGRNELQVDRFVRELCNKKWEVFQAERRLFYVDWQMLYGEPDRAGHPRTDKEHASSVDIADFHDRLALMHYEFPCKTRLELEQLKDTLAYIRTEVHARFRGDQV